MTKEGKSIVFISHKLEEVIAVADEVAILRRGEIVDQLEAADVDSKSHLARLMVGREVILDIDKKEAEIGDKVLEITDMTGVGLRNISLDVKKGEVLGVVGVAGNGQKALVEAVCGLIRPPKDTIHILGKPWRKFFAKPTWNHSLSYIPEDRKGLATAPNLDLVDNVLLTTRQGFSTGPWLNRTKAQEKTKELIKEFDVRPGYPEALGWQLSGGNLQKLVLARELYRQPQLIVAEQPTQGLDIKATEDIWNALLDARSMAGILLITGDLKEALSLSDRVAVMYRGQLMDVFPVSDREKVDAIGLLMAGVRQ